MSSYSRILDLAPLPATAKASIRRCVQKRRLVRQASKAQSRCLLRVGTWDGFDLLYRPGTADELVIAHGFDRDVFFSGVPEYRPAVDDIIIDVGAHIGTFSLRASSRVPQGKVYAIEPSMDSFRLLQANVALNNNEVVLPFRFALADQRGSMALSLSLSNWGHSTVAKRSPDTERVDSLTLSDFMDANAITQCGFLKMNCEGAEFPILLSSPRELLRRISLMLILYHCDLWSRHDQNDLIQHLEDCGFSTSIRNQSAKRGWIVALRSE